MAEVIRKMESLINARSSYPRAHVSSGASKTQMLIANYNHYLDMIRSVTGLNEARDGSTPDPNALVGVQKLAALNSNTATRHILDGSSVYVQNSSRRTIVSHIRYLRVCRLY